MTVLIVDHLAERRARLADTVRSQGHPVVLANSADEAVALVAGQAISVIFAELRLRGQDGILLLRRVKERSPEIPLILIGLDASAREYKTALAAGATEVLTQEPTAELLREVLGKALEHNQGTFTGTVHGMSLTDILQMLHYTRRSATVRFGGSAARIHLLEGQIVHAESEELRGLPALREILRRRSGAFFTAAPEPVEETIHKGFEALLLDLMRDLDEATRSPDQGPPPPSSDLNVDALAPMGTDDLAQQASLLSQSTDLAVPLPTTAPDWPPVAAPAVDLSDFAPLDRDDLLNDATVEAATIVESADLFPIEPSGAFPSLANIETRSPLLATPPTSTPLEAELPPILRAPDPILAPSVVAPLVIEALADPRPEAHVHPFDNGPEPSSRTAFEPADDPSARDDLDESVLPPKRSWAWAAVLLLIGAGLGGYFLLRPAGQVTAGDRLQGERVGTPLAPPPPLAVAEPEAGATAAADSTEAAPPPLLVIRTQPAGLLLIDTATGLPLGNAPIELRIPEGEARTVRARLGDRSSEDLRVEAAPGQSEVELDLRSWVKGD